jgi:hypothetical protein
MSERSNYRVVAKGKVKVTQTADGVEINFHSERELDQTLIVGENAILIDEECNLIKPPYDGPVFLCVKELKVT